MRKVCIVPGCFSNARTPAHQFPKDPDRRLLWLQSLKLENIEHAISAARQKIRVCYKHFNDNDYIYSVNRRKLKDNAIPCLNIPDSIKCIAASPNIDCQKAPISACNLEFCPDIVALQPLHLEHDKENIQHTEYIQEVNIKTLYNCFLLPIFNSSILLHERQNIKLQCSYSMT